MPAGRDLGGAPRLSGTGGPAMIIVLGVEYDGSAYAGWQRQRHAPSVQEDLENAIGRIANRPVRIAAAGRTDA